MLQYLKTKYEIMRGEEGVTAIEYGLLAALIAVVIIGAVTLVGGSVNDTFVSINDALNPPATGTP